MTIEELQKELEELKDRVAVLEILVVSKFEEEDSIDPLERQHREFAERSALTERKRRRIVR